MTYERRQRIENFADEIRSVLKVSIPVNMQQVINTLNGELKAVTFEDSSISGRIQKVGKVFEISYNAEHSQLRSEFTIAHELGHLFLHMGYLVNPEKWNSIDEYYDSPKYRQGYSEEEYEANHFAGAFLMPQSEYKNFIKENSVNNRIDINLIAEHFNVSFDAAFTRGKWLGIFNW